jgi:hypothetical protein
MTRLLRGFCLGTFCLRVTGATAFAQLSTAQLSGRVTDESGAVLPGVFNLFNTFNWGNPVTNFNSGTFGRITSMTGTPRIMQFGVKYGF